LVLPFRTGLELGGGEGPVDRSTGSCRRIDIETAGAADNAFLRKAAPGEVARTGCAVRTQIIVGGDGAIFRATWGYGICSRGQGALYRGHARPLDGEFLPGRDRDRVGLGGRDRHITVREAGIA